MLTVLYVAQYINEYFSLQTTLLVNNSDKPLKWTFDLRDCNDALEEGNFKFLHSSGMPFLSHGGGGVEGSLEPGQTTTVNVLFCPGK